MKKNNPLVSIIVTTKNESRNINTCLKSIKNQEYKKIEIIVVDNNSTDKTKVIASKFTSKIFNIGPERSAQRNFGALKSKGEYLLFLDADMKLSKKVIIDCVNAMSDFQSKKEVGGIIIPEESYGVGFWSQVKKLERSFYVNNDQIEAARFYSKKVFEKIGGFDPAITGPEDWDLSQRVRNKYQILRINSFIFHNEGNITLKKSILKKYYYSKKFSSYIKKKENSKYLKKQISIIERYKLFLGQPQKLFKNPALGLSVLILKTLEFSAGGIGLVIGNIKK